jgi:hypothetical protein
VGEIYYRQSDGAGSIVFINGCAMWLSFSAW